MEYRSLEDEGSEKVFIKTWNSGMLEYWNSVRFLSHDSIIPTFHSPFLSPLKVCPELVERIKNCLLVINFRRRVCLFQPG